MPRLRSALLKERRKAKAAINAEREWPLKYEPIVRLKTANFSTLALGRDGGGGVLESPSPARARPPVLVLIELRLNRGQVGTEQTLKDCVDPEMKML